ncbi:pentapeptide repeat-containing protein [candidate division KSB1 bacterium]|nr:pentapeptide repeat-containing protein [candidate division KSB1 bacterium]
MKKNYIILFFYLSYLPIYGFSEVSKAQSDTTNYSYMKLDSSYKQAIESELKLKKLESEITKLQAEVENLRISNKALGPMTRWISAVLGAISGLAGAIIGLFIWLAGRSLSNKMSKTQNAKLQQDKELSREQHNLKLFENLGNENLRIQLAAASVLIQRLMYFREQKNRNLLSNAERLELISIIHVLIAVTKDNIEGLNESFSLNKYIGDNLVIALDAIIPEDGEPNSDQPSPLTKIDFQKSRLRNVWWRRVDARDLDFFEADLSKSGFAEAFLMNAVFLQASLIGCVLRKANLEGSNLEGANLEGAKLEKANLKNSNLKGADLSGANLSGTILEGAKYNSKTKWPQNFDPASMGAILE